MCQISVTSMSTLLLVSTRGEVLLTLNTTTHLGEEGVEEEEGDNQGQISSINSLVGNAVGSMVQTTCVQQRARRVGFAVHCAAVCRSAKRINAVTTDNGNGASGYSIAGNTELCHLGSFASPTGLQ